MVALCKIANGPAVLRVHGGRTKPLKWFLEALASIYGTAPREPRYDIAEAIGAGGKDAPPARLRSLLEAIREIRPREPRSLGVAALDALLGGGLGEGEALGIGGGPGAFKTSLACTIVEAQAAPDTAVLVVAHDEDDRRVARKIGAQFGESWGELTSEYPSVLDRLEAKLAKRGAEVFVTRQAGGGTLEELVEEFERSISPGRRKVIVVDHIQSVTSSSWDDRDPDLVQIEKVVRYLIDDLKSKKNYAVIALSEVTKAALNPDSMKNAPLAAFAGTRKVASRFDVPLVLVPDGERRVLVIAAKNRFGRRGDVLLEVDPDRWKFISLDMATEARIQADSKAEEARRKQDEDDRIALDRISRQPLPAKSLESELLAAGVPSRRRAREARDRLIAVDLVEVITGERTSSRGPGPAIYRVKEKP